MNILIVSAHPEPASLTHALRDVAATQLRADGHHVRHTDLYAEGWKSAVDGADFQALHGGTHPRETPRLHVPAASGAAFAAGTLTDDVRAEQAKLLWADALILAFPLWWFSMPAILKGWIDRVYSFGFAYGVGEHSDTRWGDRYGEGTLAGKRAMLLVTAGGWEAHYGPRGINGPMDDLLFPIHHGVLFYPGYAVLPPFVVYRADRLDDAAFDAAADALRTRMRGLFTTAPIAFRRQNGGDYLFPSMTLDPGIVSATGFAAHVRDPEPEAD
ncbi:NAD(P)H-dependent oxidoreductase [Methylobacterium sp. J-090]|uniref:NAD(P)H-dependent oxidoreductase n=1 Tax=Methylobacterium sp. J-090 TaxID=2836666 RepID=UPI001FB985B0|nr:NAD(P)H-dependent oxidoreductase [Methylobacterium sp. J-090]MCJ2083296.1 NAD(P)H-dependent oxidoreductase [Methylobacterium sp. J-090]